MKCLKSARQKGSSGKNNGLPSLNVQHDVQLGTILVRFLQRESKKVGKSHVLRSVTNWPKAQKYTILRK